MTRRAASVIVSTRQPAWRCTRASPRRGDQRDDTDHLSTDVNGSQQTSRASGGTIAHGGGGEANCVHRAVAASSRYLVRRSQILDDDVALWSLSRTDHWSPDSAMLKLVGPLVARSPGLRPGLVLALEIERHRSADEIFQGRLIDLVAFVDVDGAPDVPAEAGIEQT